MKNKKITSELDINYIEQNKEWFKFRKKKLLRFSKVLGYHIEQNKE